MNYASVSYTHALVLLVDIAWVASAVWGVVDVVRTQDMRRSDKVAWAVSVVAIPMAGLIAWLIFRAMRRRSMRES